MNKGNCDSCFYRDDPKSVQPCVSCLPAPRDAKGYHVKWAPRDQCGATKPGGGTVPPLATSAPDLLDAAAGHMRDRAATYDKPEGERSMGKTVQAFNIITGRDLSESEGWLLMQLLKDVRDRQRAEPHRDSLEDCIAYSALKAEARLGGK